MNYYKRISSFFTGRLEDVVSKLENHDELISQAILDGKKQYAKTRSSLVQLQNEQEKITKEKIQLERGIEKWIHRAKSEVDHKKAIECLKRKKVIQDRLNSYKSQDEQLEKTIARVRIDVEKIQQLLFQLQNKQKILRAKEQANKGMKIVASVDFMNDVNSTLEKWESTIIENEYVSIETELNGDPIEEFYESAEEIAELEQELSLLKNS